MTFINAWNAYKQVTRNSGLTAAAQLLGYELLVRFDMARFPESITASDRELAAALGIGFRTVGDAKRRLKNAGVIDFSAKQGRLTVFKWTLTPHSDCTVAQNSNITRTRTAETTTATTTKENKKRNWDKGFFDPRWHVRNSQPREKFKPRTDIPGLVPNRSQTAGNLQPTRPDDKAASRRNPVD